MGALKDLERLAARTAAGHSAAILDETRDWVDPPTARQAAVLILIGTADGLDAPMQECDVLLVERAATLADHPGQIGFPGGGLEPQDDSLVAAATREAAEETGLAAEGVRVLGQLPPRGLPVSNFLVTPVLGWWTAPEPVLALDPAETVRAFRAPVRDLIDPRNRLTTTMRHGPQVLCSPTFLVQNAVIWGFTGSVLDWLFTELKWAREWDRNRQMPAPR